MPKCNCQVLQLFIKSNMTLMSSFYYVQMPKGNSSDATSINDFVLKCYIDIFNAYTPSTKTHCTICKKKLYKIQYEHHIGRLKRHFLSFDRGTPRTWLDRCIIILRVEGWAKTSKNIKVYHIFYTKKLLFWLTKGHF